MAHPNEELLRGAYAACARGDLEAVRSVLHERVHVAIQGDHPLAGVYVGPDEVVGFLRALAERSGGTFRLDVHDVLANDEHVVALVTARAERDGRTLAVTEAHVCHAADGRITDLWSLPTDLAASDAFWS